MHGLISWFARNSVAANLLMVFIIIAGVQALRSGKIPVEFFPEFEPDEVIISIAYRGASPAEVEEGVVTRIEEAINNVEGVARVVSIAREGAATVVVEVIEGYDLRQLQDDIKARVDAISTFPPDTENLLVRLPQGQNVGVSAILAGDLSERELRNLAEIIRDEINALPEISQVELAGVRNFEIGIEVSENTLQEYGLTLDDVAAAVRRGSVDLPAGEIFTSAGQVLVRTKGQAYVQEDFENITLRTSEDGTRLRIGDIAEVKDGFVENKIIARFNGKPTAVVNVFYSGEQSLLKVAEVVRDYIQERKETMPPGVELDLWRDRSITIDGRLQTLINSAILGGILVFGLLALFLRIELAFWVCIGIPVCFLGAIALMPTLGVTINIISLFAFILVLGIVVDDAIVTSESIYVHLRKEKDGTAASIKGAQAVAIPVTFGILTTVAAFAPLLNVSGRRGEMFYGIPAIVIPVLLFSLVESKLVLPAHLKHIRTHRKFDRERTGIRRLLDNIERLQQRVARSLEQFVEKVYTPLLEKTLHNRYIAASIFVAMLVLVVTLISSHRVKYVPFPRVSSETVSVNLQLPLGTPFEVMAGHIDHIHAKALEMRDHLIDPNTGETIVENVLVTKGSRGLSRGDGGTTTHIGEVSIRLIAPEDREWQIETQEIVKEWRQRIGPIPGAEQLGFRAEIGRGGDPIEVQIESDDFDELQLAAEELKQFLNNFTGVFDVKDDFEVGKEEIQLKIKSEAEHLGLTQDDLARQVRQAFFGEEAQRIQRGRDDIRVMVRYPREERESLENLESLRIRTPDGAEVPFANVAEAVMDRAYSTIVRINGRRQIDVSADIEKDVVNAPALEEAMFDRLAEMQTRYPGLTYSLDGEIRDRRDANESLLVGVVFTLLAIYALLAIPFRSYVQPLIVMSVIPFGLIGAVLGHMLMGKALSMFSTFGMLALSGVIVNDSLVLVDYVNQRRREGMSVFEAARRAGAARFRAIILTSLTTFFGLIPLLLEKSTQAQFLIPMAISLGFGILFATFVTLLLVPVNYLMLEDLRKLVGRYWHWQTGKEKHVPANAVTD
ncbi:MAG: efflux RND transporter permease subunit [Verrucomicrobiota bacterium]